MKQEQQSGMRRKRVNYPLALGLIASAALHLLFVLLNPGTVAPQYGRAGGTPSAPRAQFTVLSLSPRDEDDLIQVEEAPPTAPLRTPPSGTPGAAPVDATGSGRGAGPETGADVTVAERLRYDAGTFFSSPLAPMRETASQRALRETRERVLKAGKELGPLPPNGVAGSRGGGASGGGIAIPFGFKPPPPAQTVPAPPLPDSILRQDSIRAAARAAAYMDSLRAARDTTKLKYVAPPRPLVLPRVVPDTTVRER